MSPLVRQVGVTAGASMATLAANVVVVRLLSAGLGPEGFGAYSVANRLFATLAPVVTMAIGVTLTRYVAAAANARERAGYLLAACLLCAAPVGALGLAGALGGDDLARLVFGGSGSPELFRAMLVGVAAFPAFALVHAFYLGTLSIGRAALWQVAIGAAWPLAVALWFGDAGRPAPVVLAMGVGYAVAIVPLSGLVYNSLGAGAGGREAVRRRFGELWRYGWGRVVTALVTAFLVNGAALIAAQVASLRDSGDLTIGVAVLRLVDAATVAFGLVALPRAAQLAARDEQRVLATRVRDLTSLIVGLGLYGALHLLIWADELVLLWVGPPYASVTPIMRVIALATIPYLAYVVLRPIIDAVDVRPTNMVNVGAAFGVALAAWLAMGHRWGGLGLALGTTLGLTVLGGLTVHSLWRRYGFAFSGMRLPLVLGVNGVAALGAWLVKGAVTASLDGAWLGLAIAVAEGALAAGYVLALWKLRCDWSRDLLARVLGPAWRSQNAG